jgi:hypothetical protein
MVVILKVENLGLTQQGSGFFGNFLFKKDEWILSYG